MSEALRGLMGEEGLQAPLTALKLEPDTGEQESLLELQSAVRKSDKIRQIIAEQTSAESARAVEGILEQVAKLGTLDRLLLYLKLPTGRPSDIDPLRQPLNPLGSRSEIQLTINWIRTHLEEDPQISLPKHEVYDEYMSYCSTNSVKPLSTADFGKVMKQVYPTVRPRRLGTRGNSRYCYAGLRKRIKLDLPATPDIGAEGRAGSGGEPGDSEQEVETAASFLIREWVEKLLGVKFDTLAELALHLLEKMYVDQRSVAAYTLLGGRAAPPPPQDRKDSQLVAGAGQQQQQQRTEQKRKLEQDMAAASLLLGKRSKQEADPGPAYCDPPGPVSFQYEAAVADGKGELPARFSVVVPNSQSEHFIVNGTGLASFQEPQDFTSYNGESRTNGRVKQQGGSGAQLVCLEPQQQQILLAPPGHQTVIKAGEKPKSKYKEVKAEAWDGVGGYDEPADLSRLGAVQRAAVLGSGGSSSDAQEEELVRYFSQQGGHTLQPGTALEDAENTSEKLSQLRQLLEKNLKSPTLGTGGGGAFKRAGRESVGLEGGPGEGAGFPGGELGGGVSSSGAGAGAGQATLSTRRRVSFHPLIVSDPAGVAASCPVPPSPTARRRHFSFQPISPRAPGQGGAAGPGPASPPASPFISPRSTPVHMLRSRHSSGSALPLHLLPGTPGPGPARQQHPSGSAGSDISRAATFGSASESSTPFISPQGTPIPFNRSRHNSAQGRLCRSRHSSGVPLAGPTGYRYQTMPYSPMALNNLNNPFSPQPSTPAGGTGGAGEVEAGGPGGYPDRSRHSSAGSDAGGGNPGQARSAPLSPYNGGGAGGGSRQRHQSAGQLPTNPSHTIHYRPDQFCDTVTSLLAEGEATASCPAPQFQNTNGFSYQLGPATNGDLSQHSSYRNTPIPQAEVELASLIGSGEEAAEAGEAGGHKEKENNDDLDLALDALRDCDTDFIKFDQENGSVVNN